jgi:hypothetical protein
VAEATQPASVFTRVLGTARLDDSTIEEIDRDRSAIWQAAIIVTLVGVANGVGLLFTEGIGSLALLSATVGNILAWLVFASLAYLIGTGILPGERTDLEASAGGVRRTIGFAQAPNVLGGAPALIGGLLGALIVFTGFLWVILCGIVALRVSLRVSTARAIVVAIAAGVPTLIVLGIFTALFEALLL